MSLKFENRYIPVLTVHDKHILITELNELSKNTSRLGLGCAVMCLAVEFLAVSMAKVQPDITYILITCVIFAGAVSVKKWSRGGMWALLAGLLLFPVHMYYFTDNKVAFFSYVFAGLFNLFAVFFTVKCLVNRQSYVELSKEKGFPLFVFNTADIYGKKMYLTDKDKKGKNETERNENYIPFSDDPEKYAASLAQDMEKQKVRFRPVTEDVNIGFKEGKKPKEEPNAKPFILDEIKSLIKRPKGLIFEHSNIQYMSNEQKYRLMNKWNALIERTLRNAVTTIFLMLATIMIGVCSGSPNVIIYWINVILYILAYSMVKRSEFPGFFILIISVVSFASIAKDANNDFLPFFAAAVVLYNAPLLLRTVRCILNYKPVYKPLSKEKGFPSFVQNSADLYGSKVHVVEKHEPLQKKDYGEKDMFRTSPGGDFPGTKNKIIMNIGYGEKAEDEDPFKDRKYEAWNAFNYMEEKKEDEENETSENDVKEELTDENSD